MFGSNVIDVAIGLIFVYLTLSLIVSAAREGIEAWLKTRASNLEAGLREMLQDLKNDPNATGLVADLYRHGLIDSLYKGSYSENTKNKDLPSYIPASNFAVAFIDIITTEPGAETFVDSIPLIKNEQLRQTLSSIVRMAGNDIDKIRKGLEDWFNNSMDRVSGWYKRKSQKIIFALGLLFVLLLNVDTIAIVKSLSTNRAERDSVVATVQGFAASSNSQKQQDPKETINSDIGIIRGLSIPIGWDRGGLSFWDSLSDSNLFWPHIQRAIGWLVTALAISLGAPFWFDLLNKFMVVRSTVKPREKSPEEKPKS